MACLGLSTLSESILKPTGHSLQVSATASTSCSSSLGLLSPLIRATPGGRVAAGSAASLLLVEGDLTTTNTCRVGHGLTLTKRLGTLSLLTYDEEGR